MANYLLSLESICWQSYEPLKISGKNMYLNVILPGILLLKDYLFELSD